MPATPTKSPGPQEKKKRKKKEKKSSEQHEKDRVGKYALYFKGMEILPLQELVAETEPNTRSYIITDLRNKRLAGIRKDALKELLKSAGVLCSTPAGEVSRLRMSCCPRRSWQRSWPGATSRRRTSVVY